MHTSDHVRAFAQAERLLRYANSLPMAAPALGGGGRKPRRKASPQRRRRQASPRGGGGHRRYYDKDVLLQEFNHTGVFELKESEGEHCVKDVVIPLVSKNVKAMFQSDTGTGQRTLSQVLGANGITVPSLDSARQMLQRTAEQCRSVRDQWGQGHYSTIASAKNVVGFDVQRTFASIAVILDSFSSLGLEDCQQVTTALLMCSLLNHAEIESQDVKRWQHSSLDGGGFNNIISHSQMRKKHEKLREYQKQLSHEITKVQGLHQQMVSKLSGGASVNSGKEPADPVTLARNMLIMESVRRTKQTRLDLLAGAESQLSDLVRKSDSELHAKPEAPSAATKSAATPAAASVPAASQSVPVSSSGSPALSAAAPAAAAAPAKAAAAPAAAPAEAPAAPAAAPASSISSSILQDESSDNIMENEKTKLFWGGGAPKEKMKDKVVVMKDAAGTGAHLYAFLDQQQMRVNFMLEELGHLDTHQVQDHHRKRIKYVDKEGTTLGQWIQQPVNDQNKGELQKYILHLAQETDSEMANTMNSVMQM